MIIPNEPVRERVLENDFRPVSFGAGFGYAAKTVGHRSGNVRLRWDWDLRILAGRARAEV
jgi:hypothetical protein